jgi:hypothetical protein
VSVAAARALAVSHDLPLWASLQPVAASLQGCPYPTSTSSTEVSMPRTTSTSRSSWSLRSERRRWLKQSGQAPRSTQSSRGC